MAGKMKDLRAWRQRHLWPHLPLWWFRLSRRWRGLPDLGLKVLIFGPGRSGSTALQSCFPPEFVAYLHEPLGQNWKPWNMHWQPDDPAQYVEKLALRNGSRKTGVVAHVKPEHLLHQRLGASVFLQAMHAEGWKVIQLEREDSWAQGASYLRARSLGSYNTQDASEAEVLSRTPVEATPEDIRGAILRNEAFKFITRSSLSDAAIPFVRVTYEELFGPSSSKKAWQRLEAGLNLPFSLQAPSTKKVSPTEATSPHWATARAWYESTFRI